MKCIKVSIITVCRNSEAVIEKTIKSVLNQTYGMIEYIIIDGLSSDRTLEIADSYRSAFEKKGYSYRIVSEADRGIYDAMNKGVTAATGEIVGLINSGDWYEPKAVERMILAYCEEPFDLFYADLRIWRKGSSMIKHARIRKFITTRDWNHPTTFIRKSIYDQYQYSCEGIYDDWDLILRIRRDGHKVVVRNEVLANFCFGGISNRKNVKAAISRTRERYHIYRKNGFSRWYLLECILMELVKYLAA